MGPDPVIARNPIGRIVEADNGPDGLATATFDDRRQYRYRLSRVWDKSLPRIVWCLLNPSTATASTSDPTLARVVGFSRRWGAGAVEIVNLFALRTPNPKDLTTTSLDLVDDRNNEAITTAAQETNVVVAAWGNNGWLANPDTKNARSDEVMELLSSSEIKLLHLRLTKRGQPGHPLYVPRDTEARELVL